MTEEMVHDFVRAVVAGYQDAGRPEGVPEGMVFVQRARGGEKVRPCFVFGAEEIEVLHPKLVSLELVGVLETREEDVAAEEGEENGDEIAGWLAAVESVFLVNVSGQLAGLLGEGIKVKFLYPVGGVAGEPDEEDGYVAEKRWKVRLQKVG